MLLQELLVLLQALLIKQLVYLSVKLGAFVFIRFPFLVLVAFLLDERTFFKVVEVCFGMRRKKISTALRNAHMIEKGEEVPYGDDRIEQLRPVEIAEIADAVFRLRTR